MPVKITIIDRYIIKIVLEKNVFQYEYFPPTYKSGLIAKGLISFGLSVTPATSL